LKRIRGPFLAIVVLLSAAAPAQELIQNRSFDTDTMYWTLGGVGQGQRQTTTVHSAPGAVQLTNNGVGGNTEWSQCVAVTSGQMYNWGAWSFVQSGQEAMSYNQVQVYWCNSGSCSVCNFSVGSATSTTTDAWEKLIVMNSTAADGFARLVLRAHANSSTAYIGFFDDAFLGIGVTPATLTTFSAE
jgi:hypothetical protein